MSALLAVPLPCGAKFVQVLYCRIPLPLHLISLIFYNFNTPLHLFQLGPQLLVFGPERGEGGGAIKCNASFQVLPFKISV